MLPMTLTASMARKFYLRQGIDVGGFQKIYGCRRRDGSCPPHFCKSSGAIARHILQQLKDMDIIDMDPKGGRLLTSQGRCRAATERVSIVRPVHSIGHITRAQSNSKPMYQNFFHSITISHSYHMKPT